MYIQPSGHSLLVANDQLIKTNKQFLGRGIAAISKYLRNKASPEVDHDQDRSMGLNAENNG